MVLVRPKISHILAVLGPPGSRVNVKAEPRIYPGTLPFKPQDSLNQANDWGKVEVTKF